MSYRDIGACHYRTSYIPLHPTVHTVPYSTTYQAHPDLLEILLCKFTDMLQEQKAVSGARATKAESGVLLQLGSPRLPGGGTIVRPGQATRTPANQGATSTACSVLTLTLTLALTLTLT